jgi:hypothetical protein
MVWTLVEPGVAITAASLITIQPLLRALNFTGFGSTGNSSSRNLTPGNISGSIGPNISQRRDDSQIANWSMLSSAVKGPEVPPKDKGGVGVGTRPASDTRSEEYIFQGVGPTEQVEERIWRTRTVTVVVDPRPRSWSQSRCR